MNNIEESKRWLNQGERDLGAAIVLMDKEFYEGACFHSQQACEKALKSVLLDVCVEEAARVAREMGVGAEELLSLSAHIGFAYHVTSIKYISNMSHIIRRLLSQKIKKMGGYVVSCPALRGCHSQGDTMKEALANIKEAIEAYLESLELDKLPSPSMPAIAAVEV